jgi:glutamate/tyrosine decarboxylase-like PLP-dependent enzyme
MKNVQPKGLDFTKDEFVRHLSRAAELVVALHRDLDTRPVVPPSTVGEVNSLFDEPLPDSGADMSMLLDRVEDDVFPNSTASIGPNFHGYVVSGGNQVGVIADLLASALDQNAGKWHLGPAAAELELRVVRWVAEFIGYPPESAGILVSGGSAANLTCLKVARDAHSSYDVRIKGLRPGLQKTFYVSVEGHSSLDKSVDHLGIGREYLRKIPVRDDFTIDSDKLEEEILADRDAGLSPACIIGNAGTVNTGAVDPLGVLANIAEKYGMWFHIDAVYGGPAAKVGLVSGLFAGIDRADSMATDAHKWFYAPYEAGIAFVRKADQLKTAFSVVPDYLREGSAEDRFDASEYHFQLSRNFKALRLWMAFKAFGSRRLRAAIEGNIRTIGHLSRLVDASGDFERLAPAPLSIVCFRYRTEDRTLWTSDEYLSRLNRTMLAEVERDGRVFISGTIINGKQALRACSVNHRTSSRHMEYLLEVLRDIGKKIHSTSSTQP